MENRYAIIPKPVQLEPKSGFFKINPQTKISISATNIDIAKYLQDFYSKPTGYNLNIIIDSKSDENSISLCLDESLEDLHDEGYRLFINSNLIKLSAKTPKGIFYGLQSIRQLLPPEIENQHPSNGINWIIPCCNIMDYPRFSWRGFMMDEGRHFHGPGNIRRLIDLMALLKLNVLHWHLTEDQGWRMEIKTYPNLTAIGSWRAGTASSMKEMIKDQHNQTPHAGYYSQNEIRDIVLYAAEQQITVIPEIEIPGHSMAALVAYPELSCTGGPFKIPTRFGIFKDIYCAGKEKTYEFIKSVLDEIFMLFPSTTIHIGGDEAPATRWKACPDCQNRIKSLGFRGEKELRSYFLDRIIDYLTINGRRVIGWNEIIHDNLIQNAIIQYWIGNKNKLSAAAKKGNQVVVSAYLDMYLDHSYSLTPLKRAYKFEPILEILENYPKNIIGLEAPLWTEWIPNQDRLDFQTFPRLTAFAETGWTPLETKNYRDFLHRLDKFILRLDIKGIKYAKPEDWNPSFYKRLFGLLTIAQAQKRTSL